jgi:hypothetical protein
MCWLGLLVELMNESWDRIPTEFRVALKRRLRNGFLGGAAVAQRLSDRMRNKRNQKIPGSLPSPGNLFILKWLFWFKTSYENRYMAALLKQSFCPKILKSNFFRIAYQQTEQISNFIFLFEVRKQKWAQRSFVYFKITDCNCRKLTDLTQLLLTITVFL